MGGYDHDSRERGARSYPTVRCVLSTHREVVSHDHCTHRQPISRHPAHRGRSTTPTNGRTRETRDHRGTGLGRAATLAAPTSRSKARNGTTAGWKSLIEAADEVDRLSVDPEPETDTPQLSLTELRDEVRALTYHELSGIYDILGPACVRVVALFDAAHPRTT